MALVPVGLCLFPLFNFAFGFPPPIPFPPAIPFPPWLDFALDFSCPLN
jgi:hypothetical protein